METAQTAQTVTLPRRKIYRTPRPLLADAYTIGGNAFQSEEAKKFSTYYVTYRRNLCKIDPDLYDKGDDRIVFVGLSRILEKLFYEPVTHREIDDSIAFLQMAKVTGTGLVPYDFPEKEWRRVVDEFGGRPPLSIKALPEGSVVYPNEPLIQVKNLVDGFGEFAAWFESKLLHVYAQTERVTECRHWFKYLKNLVKEINPDMPAAEVAFNATLMLQDFGDRAAINLEESNELGMYHLLTFPGTDTFSGGYQAWENSNHVGGMALSVWALAHRNVQAFVEENDCYVQMYERAENGSLLSMVADCYDFYNATETYLLPLAMRSQKENNGKVIIVRPDSGNALEQVTWVCRLAKRNGLFTEKVIDGKAWYFSTTMKFIEGDGMTFGEMKKINSALMEQGFVPYSWGCYGVGGGLRNNIKRDNLSAKYALCDVDGRPVVKFSEELGKTTLCGPLKVLRSKDALSLQKTIVFESEPGDDAMVEYYNGLNIYKPFGDIMDETFLDVKKRIDDTFDIMPLTLETTDNNNFPISDAVRNKRYELLKKYAPKKRKENY